MKLKNLTEIVNDDAVRTAILAVVGARDAIMSAKQSTQGMGLTKDDANVGHHAIVTAGDLASELYILGELSSAHKNVRFLTEEGGLDLLRTIIFGQSDYTEIANHPLVFGIDPIDGTSQFERDLYEWCISIGVMRNGVHVGGAIYAPEVNRGVLVAGERSTGTFVSRGTQADVVRCSVIDRPSRDRLVAFGPDIFFMPAFSRFVIETSKKVRTTNGTGSCPLGLALVATGQLDALVQPVQSPWDWFAGWPIVEAAGGKMIFYHYKDGVPVRIETIGPDAYSPTKRNVAFIAGGPECAEELFEDLQTYWAK